MRKYNILNKWWYTWIVIPGILFIFGFMRSEADEVIASWFTIFVLTLGLQIFFNFKYSDKNWSLHFLYILIGLIISMFLSYALEAIFGMYTALENNMHWIFAKLVNAIILGIFSFAIKIIVWFLMSWKIKQNISLKEKNRKLEEKIRHLEKLNNKNQT